MRKLSASLITVITLLVLATPSALSQRTSVGRQFPVYENGGKPDLTVDPQRFTSQMEIVDRLFEEGTCAIEEGAVGGSGYRRILRFDTVVMNGGDGDWSWAIAATRIIPMRPTSCSLPATGTTTFVIFPSTNSSTPAAQP